MSKRCCCGIFSITTGAQILAALAILSSIGSIISAIVLGGQHTAASRMATGISGVLEFAAATLVFIAIRRRKSLFMTPML
ncbi:hypothetical protein PFISCL1PPCAC_14733, partial [Pristionchus fissidentatus]